MADRKKGLSRGRELRMKLERLTFACFFVVSSPAASREARLPATTVLPLRFGLAHAPLGHSKISLRAGALPLCPQTCHFRQALGRPFVGYILTAISIGFQNFAVGNPTVQYSAQCCAGRTRQCVASSAAISRRSRAGRPAAPCPRASRPPGRM